MLTPDASINIGILNGFVLMLQHALWKILMFAAALAPAQYTPKTLALMRPSVCAATSAPPSTLDRASILLPPSTSAPPEQHVFGSKTGLLLMPGSLLPSTEDARQQQLQTHISPGSGDAGHHCSKLKSLHAQEDKKLACSCAK